MKSGWVRVVGLVALAGLAFWGWRLLHPPPEQVIRKRLTALARAACISQGESQLARLASAQSLSGYFTPDVQITVDISGHSRQTWNGIDEVREAAIAAEATVSALKVQFFGINVTLGPDHKSAAVELTAEATSPGNKNIEVQELKVTMKKIKDDWLIRQVETVKTLR
ncbi:MAG TPA: hypothetical protein VN578_05745 [Candidatus Binatia bacterium]|jgi:hypothetical protein|nr:hypothetical protein [Candidatus Binatia bacterium]